MTKNKKAVARNCPFCRCNKKIFIERMRVQEDGHFRCNGCGNTVSAEKLDELLASEKN